MTIKREGKKQKQSGLLLQRLSRTNLVMVEVDGLERVARQVEVARQRLEVEPIDFEGVQ